MLGFINIHINLADKLKDLESISKITMQSEMAGLIKPSSMESPK